jgi:carboxypeptidase C (cathepsin A)
MWVGLRKRKHVQFYDNDPTLFQPLQEEVTPELVNSDGSSFDANNDYAMGYRKFEEECYFFKQSAEYELRGSACNKEKGFICEWQGNVKLGRTMQ